MADDAFQIPRAIPCKTTEQLPRSALDGKPPQDQNAAVRGKAHLPQREVIVAMFPCAIAVVPHKYSSTPSLNLRPVFGKWAILSHKNEKPPLVVRTSTKSIDSSFRRPPGWDKQILGHQRPSHGQRPRTRASLGSRCHHLAVVVVNNRKF